MTIIPELEQEYEEYKKLNRRNPYGNRIVVLGEDWAHVVESLLNEGFELELVARPALDAADHDGVTAFMEGAAASVIAKFWVHGERFRQWYNLDTQLGTEGEDASREGGVLNPAIMNIGI